MIQPALDPTTEPLRSTSFTMPSEREVWTGHQSTHDELDAEIDLRVSDELAGMYYLG